MLLAFPPGLCNFKQKGSCDVAWQISDVYALETAGDAPLGDIVTRQEANMIIYQEGLKQCI